MRSKNKIRVKRLHDDAYLPTIKHKLDAGMDLYSPATCFIPSNSIALIGLGIVVEVPDGMYGSIREKGRGYGTHPLVLGAGVLDEGYTGELIIVLKNPSNRGYTVHKGDAVAQLIIQPYMCIDEIVEIEDVPEKDSDRKGSGGVHDISSWTVLPYEE